MASQRSLVIRAGAGACLAALLFELILRQIGWDVHPAAPAPFPVEVRRLIGEGSAVSHWQEGGVRVSAGAPGPPLLAVGDSFTEAIQVKDDETFAAVLEQALGQRVVNVGRSSSSPADYVHEAPRHLAGFRPVWTVVQLNEGDLRGEAFTPGRVHFVEQGGRLRPVVPPPYRLGRISRVLGRIRSHSALVNYALARLDMYRSAAKSPPLFRAADRPAPATAPREDQWPVRELLRELAAAYDRRVTFLYLPPFTNEQAPVERALLDVCRSERLSCVDLRSSFAGFTARGRAPYGFANSRFGAGHLNAAGHRAVADLLFRELDGVRRRGLL